MKIMTAAAAVAALLTLAVMFSDAQSVRLALGSFAIVLIGALWVSRDSTVSEALSRQRMQHSKAISDAVSEAYERGRKFGAIHAEEVQEEITLAREAIKNGGGYVDGVFALHKRQM